MAISPSVVSITSSCPESTDLHRWASQYPRIHVDLGTGDGKFALHLGRQCPNTAVIGIDIALDHLHGALRRHPQNLRFAGHDVLRWPWGAIPVADEVTINFPYGSLLRGLVEGNRDLLARLDAVLGPGSRLEIRVNATAFIATGLDPASGPSAIARSLGHIADLRLETRPLCQAELRLFPSSWSKRLGYGRETTAHLIAGRRTSA